MKVVIPSAGLGTRFLPATKSQPKEMLPIVDRPIIQYVVEEAVASGADDILIITGRGKRSLEDHFDYNPDFEHVADRPEMKKLADLTRKARIHFIRQPEPKGLADAIGLARHHTGEPFGVLLGDTINVCEPPLLRQLWDHYERLQAPVIAVEPVPENKVSDYGIVEGSEAQPGLYRCHRLIEKPKPSATRSRLGITGAYVLTPEIYPSIDVDQTRLPWRDPAHRLSSASNVQNARLRRDVSGNAVRHRRSVSLAEDQPRIRLSRLRTPHSTRPSTAPIDSRR